MRGFTVLLFILLFSLTEAQEAGDMKILLPASQSLSELQLNDGVIHFELNISSLKVSSVYFDENNYIRLSIPEFFNGGRPGSPELPIFSSLIETNGTDSYRLKIIEFDSVIIDLDDYFPGEVLKPTQVSLQKTSSGQKEIFWKNDTVYASDSWITMPLLGVEQEGKMRGVNIGRFFCNPIQYHPTENQIKIFYNIVGELVPDEINNSNIEITDSRAFDNILSSVIRERRYSELKKLIREEPVTLVILSDTIFRESLQPLIEWKRKKGFNVIEAYTSSPDVGIDRESIKSYMSALYYTPPEGIASPSYLLIAGDVEHVPLSQGAGQVTDLYYTCYDGEGDYLPEVFHGRISVKNDTQLTAVIDKILEYEQFNFPDPEFLNRTILIAGYDGSYAPLHGNGQINYAADYYFNEAHGIEANVYLHPEASVKDAEIRDAVSDGAALVNYTGHGEYYGWLDPAFRTSHIESLSNEGKYPLLIGNGCSTNDFDISSRDCFAEAIVKAEKKGALAYIGCTNDSYWDEDYYWSVGVGPITSHPNYESSTFGYYDKVFHDGSEAIGDWAPSLGEMIYAGNMTVQQSNSSRKKYYWEIYQLMGDPTLVPWFAVPENPEVLFPSILPLAASSINVKASPYDYVAVSVNGNLVDALHADQFGQASLNIPDTVPEGEITLVITGDFRQPFVGSVYRGQPADPFLELLSLELSNESVEQDGFLSNGENVSLKLVLTNAGSTAIQDQKLFITCKNKEIEIIESDVLLALLNPGDTIQLNDCFNIKVKDSIADLSDITLGFSLSGDNKLKYFDDEELFVEGAPDDLSSNEKIFNSIYVRKKLHAPVIVSKNISWDDRTYGNGNDIIERGEKILFTWKIKNSGSYNSEAISGSTNGSDLSMMFQDLTFPQFEVVESLATSFYNFTAIISDAFASESGFAGPFLVSDGTYSDIDSIRISLDRHVEDFSTADLSRFYWSETDWFIDTMSFSSDPASLRSGIITHYGASTLSIEVDVLALDTLFFDYKVSSESGYDFLRFSVDSIEVRRWSGYLDWNNYSYVLGQGTHLLEWKYTKDQDVSRGDDAAWIDNIQFPKYAFDSIDLAIIKVHSPVSGPDLGMSEGLSVIIRNNGLDSIEGFYAGYSLENGPSESGFFTDTIAPGETFEILFEEVLDLSELEQYNFVIGIEAARDEYPGNDSLDVMIEHYAFPDLSITALSMDSISTVYVDLIVELTNEGNIMLDKLNYELILDEELKSTGVQQINLEPGSSDEISIRLISETDVEVSCGWHNFIVETELDSVPENNIVEGSVFWSVLSIENNFLPGIELYPNPASDYIMIRLPDNITNTVVLELLDIQGRVLQRINENNNLIQLTLDVHLENGIYSIRITEHGSDRYYHAKIIVRR